MSTTFEAYPATSEVPTYGQVIELATLRIRDLLSDYGIPMESQLVFDVRSNEHESQGIDATAPFNWQGDGYSWFYYEDVPGGTDAYFMTVDDLERQCWEEEAETNKRIRERIDTVRASLSLGHFWSFRRSAGQPAIINIAYGFLASAVAELTEGFLHSWDCAWDDERLPCTAKDFCRYWFRPEQGLSEGTKSWHKQCLESLA